MPNQELPSVDINPGTAAFLERIFGVLDQGRSVTPTDIRHALPDQLLDEARENNISQRIAGYLVRLVTAHPKALE